MTTLEVLQEIVSAADKLLANIRDAGEDYDYATGRPLLDCQELKDWVRTAREHIRAAGGAS